MGGDRKMKGERNWMGRVAGWKVLVQSVELPVLYEQVSWGMLASWVAFWLRILHTGGCTRW